jgi:hypothetical protein
MDSHPAESDEDCSPESFSDTINWFDWNGDLDNPNDSEDDWEVDNESGIELNNCVRDLETKEKWIVSAAPDVPELIWPPRRSMKQVEKVVLRVGTMETRRRNKGIKKCRID